MAQHTRTRAAYDLLSSMRFAISLLTVLAVASVVGTVLKQAEPYPNYISQFGPFWFPVFETLGLYDVYHASWFLLILGFLVLSTSLCIYRNGPAMLREMRNFREQATERSLQHIHHRAEYGFAAPAPAAGVLQRAAAYLTAQGFRYRITARGEDTLIAAKAGSYHRSGYLLTHCGIVVICVGGLLDGNVPLKLRQLTGQIVLETRDVPQSQVPPQSRLSPSNPSFRGNVNIPEGTSANVVFQNVADGYLVQDLPFTIALKKFHIEHYSTGQPRDFASDIVVVDHETGERFERTIRVNYPFIHRGIAIYQASFADGGTRMQLKGWPLLSPQVAPFDVAGAVNQATRITSGDTEIRVELSDFRPFNIEDLGANTESSRIEVASVSKKVLAQLGSGAADLSKKDLRNVGPSFQYRLRDTQGQAREFSNYMLPLQLDGAWYLMTGVRASPNEGFRFLRLPLDGDGRVDGHMRLRAVLLDEKAWPEIGRRFARNAVSGASVPAEMRARLAESAEKVLQLFALRGFESVGQFIEKGIPQAEQEKAADVYVKVLEGAALEALQLARERAGLPPAPFEPQTLRFIRDTLTSVSDSFAYGAPVYLQLVQYEEVKASGLQLTRAPGQNIVYGGSLMLVLGVFAMLYIRERRIWLLVKPAQGKMLLAMATNRQTLENEREFERHKAALAEVVKG
ncbi:MAG: cytochrome c biogenesis protein ResB [Burkholderiales bacterium]|nr:cytochrome c biogenesis protein ResB [Burkholderiales bacterium]MCW5603259.1 cytochrome c biogenesis protein ResB [Burkholderiales bacterium]